MNGLRLAIVFDPGCTNTNNLIGGTTPAERNVISDNSIAGISLSGANTSNNVIKGNYIGLTPDGTAVFGTQSVGIDLIRGTHDNIIGGDTVGERNVISGNTFVGISIYGTTEEVTSNNHIRGNYIGTDKTGTLAILNYRGGVGIGQNATGNVIGGTLPGEGNVISGHTGATPHGIRISQSSGNFVYGNIIGLTANGSAPLPNGYGIRLESGADDNVIGGPGTNMGNIISGNNNSGIFLGGGGGNIIQGNFIGTDVSGTAALGNIYYGVIITDSSDNIIGGTTPASRNLISGGHLRGIRIDGATASNNNVLGNYIGTDISGTLPLGNTDGIRIAGAPNNTIGGTETGESNVISGNDVFGIVISNSSATGNQVLGNMIGTDMSGTVALGNGTTGIYVGSSASGNIIGGTETGAGNLISSNGNRGIHLADGASNNQVLGNLIGTDISGTSDLGNGWDKGDGIMIHTSNNIIGGIAPGARNIISGNSDDGISILGVNAFDNQIIGNYIGTDITGTAPLENFRGIQIWSALNNTISNNLIHYNDTFGVLIQHPDADNNTVTQNSITGNGISDPGKGIRVGDNANQNILPPVITAVTSNQVLGTATAPDSSIIEIFQDTGDQGNIFIGATAVSAGVFTLTGFSPPGATGGNLTATVTDPDGNTSEFSLPVPNNLSASTASVWQIETVDAEGITGGYASLAMHSSYPHIGYFDWTSNKLKYARFDGTNWHIEINDEFAGGTYLAMVLDSNGNPHISCSSGFMLKYTYYDGIAWHAEDVDPGKVAFTSIALDSEGHPHISYSYAYELRYAFLDGTMWHSETVDTTWGDEPYGIYTSIALDSSGNPHISYFGETNHDLKYAHYDGTSWHTETVDSAGRVGMHTSIALDSLGYPHISYYDFSNYDLKYTYYDGTSWHTETVDSEGFAGDFTSIALDLSSYPHISYRGNGDLKYAYYNGSSWLIENVDSEGWVGYTSLELDSSGNPYISYQDLTKYDLKYAYRSEIGISDSATVTTGEGDMTVSISDGSFAVQPEIVDPGFGIPDGFLTPYGALSYTISTDLGATVTVIITLPEEPPPGTILFKCITSVCSPIVGAIISGNQAIFDVTDGGDLDEDEEENEQIVEPSVLAVPAHPEIAVDVKPGSCPNPLNIKSKGVLPVSIIGTEDFDVTRIDPASINLMGIAPLRWSLKDVATPYEPFTGKEEATDCNDSGPDGLTDLTLKFDTQELVQTFELLLGVNLEDGEALVVRLIGNLREEFGSAQFIGEDVMVILKK
jgi:parallel beta-helix repeat protein